MSWWGKLIGGAVGFAAAGPLGSLLGLVLGHQFDRGLDWSPDEQPAAETPALGAQAAFFSAVFAVMGHLCKADGQVSPAEIATAEAVMTRMQLAAAQRRAAIELFKQGKQPDFPLTEVLAQLKREVGRKRDLLRMFLEVLFVAAYADGGVTGSERALLARIAQTLGFATAEAAQIEAMVRPARSGDGKLTLAEAYRRLGVDPAASLLEVKRAYRRLLSQHHPDKLIAQGLPEEMVVLANQKTREIKDAYERVAAARAV